MSDFVEWNPKHHGHQPLHWKPDMLTSVDGKNFVRQPNWAWIAGSVYYVPPEAVGMVREDVEEETGVDRTNYCTGCKERQDRIEALTAENKWLRHCLKNANDKHEFYEREWYLRGDRIEALTAALVEIRTCTTEHGGAAKASRIINAALEKQP